jgi:hypothetical protein
VAAQLGLTLDRIWVTNITDGTTVVTLGGSGRYAAPLAVLDVATSQAGMACEAGGAGRRLRTRQLTSTLSSSTTNLTITTAVLAAANFSSDPNGASSLIALYRAVVALNATAEAAAWTGEGGMARHGGRLPAWTQVEEGLPGSTVHLSLICPRETTARGHHHPLAAAAGKTGAVVNAAIIPAASIAIVLPNNSLFLDGSGGGASSDPGNGGVNVGAAVGGTTGAVAAALLYVAAVVLIRRQRRRAAREQQQQVFDAPAVHDGSTPHRPPDPDDVGGGGTGAAAVTTTVGSPGGAQDPPPLPFPSVVVDDDATGGNLMYTNPRWPPAQTAQSARKSPGHASPGADIQVGASGDKASDSDGRCGDRGGRPDPNTSGGKEHQTDGR